MPPRSGACDSQAAPQKCGSVAPALPATRNRMLIPLSMSGYGMPSGGATFTSNVLEYGDSF